MTDHHETGPFDPGPSAAGQHAAGPYGDGRPDAPGALRTLLVTGAGGAGRTTVAAAAAMAAAQGGARTLLLSAAEPAHLAALAPPAADDFAAGDSPAGGSTSITGLPVPYPVADADALYAARIDSGASFRAGVLDVQNRIGALLGMLGAPPLDPEELTELPGATAMATLHALRESHALDAPPIDETAPFDSFGDAHTLDDAGPFDDGSVRQPARHERQGAGWDLVVVDLPPVRQAVALLALPGQLRRYLARLLPADRQAARALRPVLAQLAGVPMPAEWAYDAAARADRRLAAVQAVIDDARTAVVVVAEPGPDAARTVRTARTGLALHGHRLAGVIANRLLPAGSDDAFLQTLSGGQRERLEEVAEECAADGVPLYELPHLGRAPRTAGDLAGPLAGLTAAGSAASAEPGGMRRPDPWTVEDKLVSEGHYEWRLPLPGATRDGLDLVRRGDELVVDTGGFRRIMPLPSALRRCTVAGAALRDGALAVRFTPDPGLWPR